MLKNIVLVGQKVHYPELLTYCMNNRDKGRSPIIVEKIFSDGVPVIAIVFRRFGRNILFAIHKASLTEAYISLHSAYSDGSTSTQSALRNNFVSVSDHKKFIKYMKKLSDFYVGGVNLELVLLQNYEILLNRM